MDFDFARDDMVLKAVGRNADDSDHSQNEDKTKRSSKLLDSQSEASHMTGATKLSFAHEFLLPKTNDEVWMDSWMKKVRQKFSIPDDLVFPESLSASLKAAFQLEKTLGRDSAWQEVDALQTTIKKVMVDKVLERVRKMEKATRREVVFGSLKEIAGMKGYGGSINWEVIDKKMRECCLTSPEKISAVSERVDRGNWLYMHLFPCLSRAIESQTVSEDEIVSCWRIWLLLTIHPVLASFQTIDQVLSWCRRNEKDLVQFIWEREGKITAAEQKELDAMVIDTSKAPNLSAAMVLESQQKQQDRKKLLQKRNRRTVIGFIRGKIEEVEQSPEPWVRYLQIQAAVDSEEDEEITLAMGAIDGPLRARAQHLENQKTVKLITDLWTFMFERKPMPRPDAQVVVDEDSPKIDVKIHFAALLYPVQEQIYTLAQWCKAVRHLFANLVFRGFDTYHAERMADTIQTISQYRFPKELGLYAMKTLIIKDMREINEKVMTDTAAQSFEEALRQVSDPDLSHILKLTPTIEEKEQSDKRKKEQSDKRKQVLRDWGFKDDVNTAASATRRQGDVEDLPPAKRRSLEPSGTPNPINAGRAESPVDNLTAANLNKLEGSVAASVRIQQGNFATTSVDVPKTESATSIGNGANADEKVGAGVQNKEGGKATSTNKFDTKNKAIANTSGDQGLGKWLIDINNKKAGVGNNSSKPASGNADSNKPDEKSDIKTATDGELPKASPADPAEGRPNGTPKTPDAKMTTTPKMMDVEMTDPEVAEANRREKEIKEASERIFGGNSPHDRESWIRLCATANLLGNDSLSNVIGMIDDVWEKKHEIKSMKAASTKKNGALAVKKPTETPPPMMWCKVKALVYAAAALQKLGQKGVGSGDFETYEIPSSFVGHYNSFKSVGVQMKKIAAGKAGMADPKIVQENAEILAEFGRYAEIIEQKLDQVMLFLIPDRDMTVTAIKEDIRNAPEKGREILRNSGMHSWLNLKPLRPSLWLDMESHIKTCQAEARLAGLSKKLKRSGSC